MASKKMKYASLAGVVLMSTSLVACANETEKPITLGDSMTQNGIQKIENSSVADKCREYELQKDGSYKCDTTDDSSSGGSGVSSAMWFFNGMLFGSHNQMTSSSNYKANNLINGTKTTSTKSTPSGTKSNSSNSSKSNVNLNKSSTSGSKSGGFGSGGKGSSGGS